MRAPLTVVGALIVVGSVLVTAPLRAHHAFAAAFDENRPINLEGTVTKVELVNPHSWIHIDVKDPDGKVTNWAIEGGTPNTLFRLGITKNSLPIGTELVVDGYRSKDGSNKANGRDISFVDGRKVFIGGSSPGAPPR